VIHAKSVGKHKQTEENKIFCYNMIHKSYPATNTVGWLNWRGWDGRWFSAWVQNDTC